MKYTDEFVIKVNEVYHDAEALDYESKHPEIFKDEVERWQKAGGKYFKDNDNAITILDIGTGTGFVPQQIGSFLKKEDKVICSDISKKILEQCRKNLYKKLKCQLEYHLSDGRYNDIADNSIDYITLNSVLHHIPNLEKFFSETDRLLRIGGRLIIGHEPNKKFFNHWFLWRNYRIVSFIVHPREFVYMLLRLFKLLGVIKKIRKMITKRDKEYNKKIVDEVNRCLIKGGVLKQPLTVIEISEIVDIHSPTAGALDKSKGIDINEIIKKYLTNYKLEYLETYNHLSKLSSRNRFTSWYDLFLRKKFSRKGSLFLVVLRKQG